MKKMIILNHKMNLEYDQIHDYINKLNKIKTDNNIVVCPTSIYLESFINYCSWGVGAQNFYYKSFGNYTGEVSVLQLKSLGIEYSLIGHYERKKYFHETNKIIHEKLIACLEANIVPILCFGETGNVDDAINDLDIILKDITNINFIVFAYEPLKVSNEETIERISDDIAAIYNYLEDRYHIKPNIIYGGGVSSSVINQVLEIDKLNGILIGKLSSNVDKISKIIESIK